MEHISNVNAIEIAIVHKHSHTRIANCVSCRFSEYEERIGKKNYGREQKAITKHAFQIKTMKNK